MPAEGWEVLQDKTLQPESMRKAFHLITTVWQDETNSMWKHSMTQTLEQELMSGV